jgi:hypothetical protein
MKFSHEEMDLLLELAPPIEPRQQEQFLHEATATLEAMAEKTGTNPGPGPGRLHRIVGAIQRKYRGSPELGEDG